MQVLNSGSLLRSIGMDSSMNPEDEEDEHEA
jgi:hypothetical protein